MSFRRGVVTFVSLSFISLALAVCAAGDEVDVVAFDLVNAHRAVLALPGLTTDSGLDADARRWAEHLADTGTLSHDALKLDGWAVLGENVGRGGTIEAVQRAFEDSPTHERNLVGDYTHLGVAVAARGDVVWVVQRFASRAPAPVPTAVLPVTLAPVTTTVTLAPPVLCQQVD